MNPEIKRFPPFFQTTTASVPNWFRIVGLFFLAALGIAGVGIAIAVGIDFRTYFHAARSLYSDPAAVYRIAGPTGGYFYYGPIFLVFTAPLGLLSEPVAKWIWIALQCATYAMLWRILLQNYPALRRPLAGILFFLFSIAPLHSNFQSLNIQMMLLVALMAAQVASRSERQSVRSLAGALAAICALIKVFPAFIVAYTWIRGDRRIRLGIVFGLLIGILAPVICFGMSGVEYWREFFGNMLHYEDRNSVLRFSYMISVPAVIARLVAHAGFSPSIASAFTVLAFVGISVCFFGAVWWRKLEVRTEWPLALMCMTLLNPTSMPHYFVFFLPGIACLLSKYSSAWRLYAIQFGMFLVAWAAVVFTTDGVIGRARNHLWEEYGGMTLAYCMLTILLVVPWKRAGDARAIVR